MRTLSRSIGPVGPVIVLKHVPTTVPQEHVVHIRETVVQEQRRLYPVEEQRRLYGAAARQVTAHDDGRGDDDATGIRHDSAWLRFVLTAGWRAKPARVRLSVR